MCRHWDISVSEPNWSDWTPGRRFEMWCRNGHWLLDPYTDGTETLRRYMLMAGSCPDFDQVGSDHMDKFNDWIKQVKKFQIAGTMRKGQSWMNALAVVDPKLYREWTGKDWDCFHDDSKCHAFINKLLESWSILKKG